jgi:predicted amidohydrolase
MKATFLNEADRALDAVRALIADAGRQQLDLLVLPECSYPAYLLGSVASYRQSGCLSGDDYLAELQEQARTHRVHIAAGFVHEVGDVLYNAAALLSPRGDVLGIYHKLLMWHVDSRWFQPGDNIAALDTELGRIGILICADVRVPEEVATLAADGAELICVPTCWIDMPRQPGEHYNPQADFLIQARSLEFGVPFACANKFGVETAGTGYCGLSLITAADGTALAQADAESAGVICAEVEPTRPRLVQVEPGLSDALLAPPEPLPAVPDGPTNLRMALMSGTALRNHPLLRSADSAQEFFQTLRMAGVSLLFALAPDEAAANALAQLGLSHGISVAAVPVGDGLSGQPGLLYGTLSAQQAGTFAPARTLALRGARLIAVFGDDVPQVLLRARALENRIFVAAVESSSVSLTGVNGAVVFAGYDQTEVLIVEIDRAQADDKCVAPGTDIIEQRRPASYRF